MKALSSSAVAASARLGELRYKPTMALLFHRRMTLYEAKQLFGYSGVAAS